MAYLSLGADDAPNLWATLIDQQGATTGYTGGSMEYRGHTISWGAAGRQIPTYYIKGVTGSFSSASKAKAAVDAIIDGTYKPQKTADEADAAFIPYLIKEAMESAPKATTGQEVFEPTSPYMIEQQARNRRSLMIAGAVGAAVLALVLLR